MSTWEKTWTGKREDGSVLLSLEISPGNSQHLRWVKESWETPKKESNPSRDAPQMENYQMDTCANRPPATSFACSSLPSPQWACAMSTWEKTWTGKRADGSVLLSVEISLGDSQHPPFVKELWETPKKESNPSRDATPVDNHKEFDKSRKAIAMAKKVIRKAKKVRRATVSLER